MTKFEKCREKIKNVCVSVFKVRKPIFFTWWIDFLAVILSVFLILGIPILINELYKVGTGYITLWDASDVLAFYAVILSGFITIGGLVVTIIHTKKDTERQIKFYMAQTKQPFFVIDHVRFINSKKNFSKENDVWKVVWQKINPERIIDEECDLVEIILKNIGDGIALSPTYDIHMMSGKSALDKTVRIDNVIRLEYNFKANLDDKWVKTLLREGVETPGQIVFNTYIIVSYQNIFGVKLMQKIMIAIQYDFGTKELQLSINEISPQEIEDI